VSLSVSNTAMKPCGLFCTAHAKLMMHEEVTVQDAVCAVALMESSMQVTHSHSLHAALCADLAPSLPHA